MKTDGIDANPTSTALPLTVPDPRRADSPRSLGVILLSRIALNLQFRIVYPFLPAISRGLGVPLETASLLLTVRSLVGVGSPFYGALADRFGRRVVMLAGLVALVLGAIAVGLSPTLAVALLAFALLGFSKSSYDPAMQAYLGDAVPYERRGRVLSIVELAWSLSWFIGVPAAGFLIASAGWRAPFWFIAGLGFASLLAMLLLCPSCGRGQISSSENHRRDAERAENHQASPRLRGAIFTHRGVAPGMDMSSEAGRVASLGRRPAWASRAVFMALAVPFLVVLANENVFIVYGAWLESELGLTIVAVGVASLVISAAELIGEGASAGLVDRLGKRRAVLGGLVLNVLSYLALPRLAGGLGTALTGVFLMFLSFEFSIVAIIPLVSELAPETRGTVMALNVAGMSLGRMISSLLAPRLWATGGLPLNALVSAGVVMVAALILWRGVRERSS